ncbi:unnamed protein product [Aphanomyces euteiches]
MLMSHSPQAVLAAYKTARLGKKELILASFQPLFSMSLQPTLKSVACVCLPNLRMLAPFGSKIHVIMICR